MKVIITGATGFVGKRLLNFFEYNDIDLTVISSKNIQGCRCILHNGYKMPANSIEEKFDCLILLGGVTPKGKGNDVEVEYLKNIYSTVNIIDAFKVLPSKIIYVSSVSIYENSVDEINEESPLTTKGMYGLSKIICERFLEEKCRTGPPNLSILRLGPVYGPGEESYNKMVGFFIKQAVNNETITIKSNGKENRNFVYVDDVAKVIATLALNSINAGIVNVVSPNLINIYDLAKKVVSISNSHSEIVILNNGNGREDNYSPNKVIALFDKLGLQFTPYEKGIFETYQYFKEKHFV